MNARVDSNRLAKIIVDNSLHGQVIFHREFDYIGLVVIAFLLVLRDAMQGVPQPILV